ncbi:MAG: hypothetical protein KBC64_03345 [Simkaniaceae bacterium]|nr:hypothetical protein [Simkaniaceae bacterium]
MIPFFLASHAIFFTPPPDWLILEPKNQPKEVSIGFVEKDSNYPSTINMAIEKTDASLPQYVQAVKKLYQHKRNQTLRDLGSLPLKIGRGHLLEIDTQTSHGIFRQLQLLYPYQGDIIILTSASKEQKFLKVKDQILTALKSLTIAESILDTLTEEERQRVDHHFLSLKQKNMNEKEILEKFASFLHNEFPEKGSFWELLILEQIALVKK